MPYLAVPADLAHADEKSWSFPGLAKAYVVEEGGFHGRRWPFSRLDRAISRFWPVSSVLLCPCALFDKYMFLGLI